MTAFGFYLQKEIEEKMPEQLKEARKRLCDKCKRAHIGIDYDGETGYDCILLPITSKGEDCPYFEGYIQESKRCQKR